RRPGAARPRPPLPGRTDPGRGRAVPVRPGRHGTPPAGPAMGGGPRRHRARRPPRTAVIGPPLPRVPFRALVGNLAWTHDGTVWAVWRIDPVPYRYATGDDKVTYSRVFANLLRALRGEPLLLSLCGRLDADAGPRP